MDPSDLPDFEAIIKRAVAAALERKPEQRKLHSVNAAAEAWGTSRSTVYSLMRAGAVKFVMIGTDRRIPDSEIERGQREGITMPKATRPSASWLPNNQKAARMKSKHVPAEKR